MFFHILILSVFAGALFCSIVIYRDIKIKLRLKKLRRSIISSVNEFNSFINDEEYFNKRKLSLWQNKYSALCKTLNFNITLCGIGRRYEALIKTFKDYFNNCESIRNNYNSDFAKKELIVCSDLFDNFESHPLSEKQREAIVHDEDNSLVIAGAGTGKTTTIAGKAAYLLNRLKIPPEQILLLTFTNSSAGDMAYRIYDKIGIDLDVKTFHKFGLDIISRVEGEKPSLAFDKNAPLSMDAFITKAFSSLTKTPDFLGKVNNFFLFYKNETEPLDCFNLQKNKKPPPIQRRNDLMTLQKEVVKSREERIIADFLFINGINYKYEEAYRYKTATVDYRQYQPDFYLTDYDIYIEHFGISKDGSVANWMKSSPSKSEKELYNEGIIAKRELHNKYNTTLIETYSYENQEGNLLTKLEHKLKAHKVLFIPKTPTEVFNAIKNREKEDITAPFINLLISFLHLVKSNNFCYEELENRAKEFRNSKRNLAFIELFWPIYIKYQDHLAENSMIDFSDMIIKAAKYIEDNRYILPYKYILIDEFQDISIGRYKLIKAGIHQNSDIKLFCVGDDWQSIFRFTGSDLSLITDFEKYFGYTKTTYLDTTYRFNEKISEFSSAFIQKNPRQLKRQLKTIHKFEGEAKEVVYSSNPAESIENILSEISLIKEIKVQKVFIINRYNNGRTRELNLIVKKFPYLEIEFLTAHKSKGMEADYVIIINLKSGIYGFPAEMHDDPVFDLVLTTPENYQYAEERRVFYVAMTRAKKKVFFIADKNNPSIFIDEI